MTLHRLALKALPISLFLSISLGAIQKGAAEVPAGLDDFVKKAMQEYNVPGMSLAIVEGDQVTVRGYGRRSVDKPGDVDGDTIFPIASNTKPFTAALAAIMVDEGKIDWDDHVMDHWPVFALHDMYASRMCTLRDLLAHRSGLPAFSGDNLEALGFTREQIVEKLKYLEPRYSFRERDGYSNPGILAAGLTAATVGGGTYESLMKERLFNPLGMARTGIAVKNSAQFENAADAHVPLAGGVGSKVMPWDNPPQLAPAGAITSTAKDMSQWVRMQLNDGSFAGKQLISAKSIEEMHTPAMVAEATFAEMAPIDAQSGFSYGLGWGIYHYKGHQIIEKGGARLGVRSIVTMVPDKKIGIVVLANQNLTPLPEAVRAYLMDAMVEKSEKDLQAEIRKANKQIQEMFGRHIVAFEKRATSLPLDKYVGEYSNKLSGVVRVYVEGGKLRWQAGPDKISGSLEPLAYDTFLLSWPEGRVTVPEEVTFTLAPGGYPTALATDSFGALARVEKK